MRKILGLVGVILLVGTSCNTRTMHEDSETLSRINCVEVARKKQLFGLGRGCLTAFRQISLECHGWIVARGAGREFYDPTNPALNTPERKACDDSSASVSRECSTDFRNGRSLLSVSRKICL